MSARLGRPDRARRRRHRRPYLPGRCAGRRAASSAAAPWRSSPTGAAAASAARSAGSTPIASRAGQITGRGLVEARARPGRAGARHAPGAPPARPARARRPPSASAAMPRSRPCSRRLGAACRRCIHEQNAVLGRANRVLAPRVDAHRPLVRAGRGAAQPGRRARGHDRQPGARRDRGARRRGPITRPAQRRRRSSSWSPAAARARAVFSRVVPAAVALLPEAARRRLVIAQQCRAGRYRGRRAPPMTPRASTPSSRPSSTTCRRGWPRRIW